MADRFPLILNTSTNQIQEIPSGDNLDLTGVGINNAGIITASSFSGPIVAGAGTSDIVAGIITATQIDLNGDIDVDGHTELDNVNVVGVTTFNEDISFKGANFDFLYDRSQNTLNFDQGIAAFGTAGQMTLQNSTLRGVTNILAGGLYIKNLTNHQMITCYNTAQVEIYHNNNKKFNTTNTGVEITGNLVASGNVTAVDGTFSGNVSIGGTLTYEDVTNIDSVGIVTAREGVVIPSNKQIKFGGDSTHFKIEHNTNENYIDSNSGHIYIRANVNDDEGDNIYIQPKSGENSAVFTHDGAVELYFNNEVRYATSGYGANIFGQNAAVSFNLHTAGGTKRGGLYATNGNVISLLDGQDHQILRGVKDGTAELYFDNAKKIETTSTGATVTGTLTATSFSGDGSNLTGIDTDLVSDTSPQLGGTLDVNGQVISFPDSDGTTNQARFGTGNDLKIYHQSNSSYIINATGNLNIGSNNEVRIKGGSDVAENMAVFKDNGAVELYYDATKRLETTSTGAAVTGALTTSDTITVQKSAQASLIIGSTNAGGAFLGLDGDSNGDASGGDYSYLRHNTSGDLEIVANKPSGGANLRFYANAANLFLTLSSSGNLYPQTNNAQDLGTTAYRFRNIYVNDLQLSNEAKKDEGGNDVDGTWGDFTIQEGESDLYLINNRNGKKYKFNLTEVS